MTEPKKKKIQMKTTTDFGDSEDEAAYLRFVCCFWLCLASFGLQQVLFEIMLLLLLLISQFTYFLWLVFVIKEFLVS